MAIVVVCPACNARFRVSDKYAGRQGPCPKCKTTIIVPAAADEEPIVVPQTDEETDGEKQSTKFQSLPREETKIQPLGIALAGIVLLAFIVAALLRGSDWKSSAVLLGLGAVVMAPPLALAGYALLRQEELEPHRGVELICRVAICAAAYVILWAVLWGLKSWLIDDGLESWNTLFLLVGPLAVGSVTAWATLDLDLGSGLFHYCLYLGVCVLLRLTMGLLAL
jgi:predicted Zn finger-like uncharacterized protein